MYKVKGKELITNSFKIKFDYRIQEVIEHDLDYYILLNIPSGIKETNNFFALNADGSIKWRIENTDSSYDYIKYNEPYTLMSIDNGYIFITTFMGMQYKVDLENGNIADERFVK